MPELLILGGADVAEVAVSAFGVVEIVDVIGHRDGQFHGGGPLPSVQQFGLHASPERLNDRVDALCQGSWYMNLWRSECLPDFGEDLAGSIAFEQAQDLFTARSGGGASSSIFAGCGSLDQPVVRDRPKCTVGKAISAGVEPVALGFAAGVLDGACAA